VRSFVDLCARGGEFAGHQSVLVREVDAQQVGVDALLDGVAKQVVLDLVRVEHPPSLPGEVPW
jgi:hypothetical protein